MDFPPNPIVGESVALNCAYDMEGDELYSVKWYKGGYEFYRYMPKDTPPAQMYGVPGIRVDLRKSDRHLVTLREVNLSTSGKYRCEISAEAPSFSTVYTEKDMYVVDLPEEGPKISGVLPQYQIGDTVHMNCTSLKSKPAAMLTWSINDVKVPKKSLKEYPIVFEDGGLETSVLGLEFQVEEIHIKDGDDMSLRCTATILPLYHQSNEQSVTARNYQLTSVLESKSTLHVPSNSAADLTPSISYFALSLWCQIKAFLR